MHILITYDVETTTREGRRRLRLLAKECENKGQRVQYSVFECNMDNATWIRFKSKLLKTIDPEKDSLRFYILGNNWRKRVEHHGAKPGFDIEGPLIA